MSESGQIPILEVLARERALLLPLRQKHAAELLAAGVIDRLFAPHIERGLVPDPIDESDELVPYRKQIPNQTIRAVVAKDGRALPLKPEELVEQPSYALRVHRTSRVTPMPIHKAYFVGDVVSEPLAQQLDSGLYLPGIGMRPQDVELVAAQLKEVAAVVEDRELTTINAETLMEDSSTYNIRKPTLP
jgi:hypothetical protein